MGYVIVFIILGVILVFVLKKKKQLEAGEKDAERQAFLPENATIEHVKVGGVISISGFMADYQDLDFLVEQKHRYEKAGFSWYELAGSHGTKKLFIEWEKDDGEFFIIATSASKGFRLSKLGIEQDDLVRMDDEQSRDNFIEFEGEKYYFDESGEIFYYENESGSGEGFYCWDFINEDETKVISIEQWEGEPFEVFTGTVISHDDIQIFKVK